MHRGCKKSTEKLVMRDLKGCGRGGKKSVGNKFQSPIDLNTKDQMNVVVLGFSRWLAVKSCSTILPTKVKAQRIMEGKGK